MAASILGVPHVAAGGSSAAWADRQILDRPAQVGAALALVRSLQAQFGIATRNVVGHATANAAPQFHDRSGGATTTPTGRPPTSPSSARGSEGARRSTSLSASIPGWSAGRARLTLNQD